MKIGIITFHWATNYGAIMQTFALQNYLLKMGHEVYIIDFKPKKYDFTLFNMIRSRAILNPMRYVKNWRKEKGLVGFRKNNLKCTRRYYSVDELKTDYPPFDIYISGSDQVLNPSFTRYGEDGNRPSSAYFLDFGKDSTVKLGYAISFGCTIYPEISKQLAIPLINNFDKISVRENSGVNILSDMGCFESQVVPDPTLLLKRQDYESLINDDFGKKNNIVFYIIHNRKKVVKELKSFFKDGINITNQNSVESWLCDIKNSKKMVTNSFHGVVFCLKFHIQFVIVLKSKKMTDGNDRFYTLLQPLGLTNLILDENEIDKINILLNYKIDWILIDEKINEISEIGKKFLMEHLHF